MTSRACSRLCCPVGRANQTTAGAIAHQRARLVHVESSSAGVVGPQGEEAGGGGDVGQPSRESSGCGAVVEGPRSVGGDATGGVRQVCVCVCVVGWRAGGEVGGRRNGYGRGRIGSTCWRRRHLLSSTARWAAFHCTAKRTLGPIVLSPPPNNPPVSQSSWPGQTTNSTLRLPLMLPPPPFSLPQRDVWMCVPSFGPPPRLLAIRRDLSLLPCRSTVGRLEPEDSIPLERRKTFRQGLVMLVDSMLGESAGDGRVS